MSNIQLNTQSEKSQLSVVFLGFLNFVFVFHICSLSNCVHKAIFKNTSLFIIKSALMYFDLIHSANSQVFLS